MKAVLFTGMNEVQLVDIPDPKPGLGEVLIEVKASGICHTDYEVLKDNYGTGAFPVVPGHEYAGEIVDLGPDVQNLSVGDRVAVDPNFECGSCSACSRGWTHLCERLGAHGVTTHGGFAKFSVVNKVNVVPIGSMNFTQAALSEPMGCVLNGIDAVHDTSMETALIFGAGPMGLLMGLALKARGISKVAFCDISEERLELASSFGFETVGSVSDQIRNWHQRADLVVEATGVPQVAARLPNYIANGGKGLFFGVCPSDAKVKISPFEIFRRQLTLAGSHSLNHNIPEALKVIKGLGATAERIVSHRVSLEDVSTFFSSGAPAGSLKVHWVAD